MAAAAPAPMAWTEYPARMIDGAMCRDRAAHALPLTTWLWCMFWALVVFPVCALADVCTSVLAIALHRGPASDELRALWWKLHKAALGVLAFPVALLRADIVTAHYTQPAHTPDVNRRFGGLYSYANASDNSAVRAVVSTERGDAVPVEGCVFTPRSHDELVAVVRAAAARRWTVTVKGAGLSQGGQTLPPADAGRDDADGWTGAAIVDMRRLCAIEVHSATATATVGAGATWAQVQACVNTHGLSVGVMQASNIFSVGGSVAADAHGWDHRAGAIEHTLRGVRVVTADGATVTVRPGDELFNLVVGGYGLFGVISSVHLALTANVRLQQRGKVVSLDEYLDYFDSHVNSAGSSVALHLYRLSVSPHGVFGLGNGGGGLLDGGFAQNYHTLDGDGAGDAVVSQLVDEPDRGARHECITVGAMRISSVVRTAYWLVERAANVGVTMRGKRDNAVGAPTTRNEVMRAKINALFDYSEHQSEWLSEYFLPRAALVGFVRRLGRRLTHANVVLLNASVRYVSATDAAMGYASPSGNLGAAAADGVFAVVLCFSQEMNAHAVERTRRLTRTVVQDCLDSGGTFYLPYQRFATRRQFDAGYPQWRAHVAALKEKYDPHAMFRSQLYADYMSPELRGDGDEFVHVRNTSPVRTAGGDGCDSGDAAVVGMYRAVFAREPLPSAARHPREMFRDFLTNVFMQLDDDRFLTLVDDIMYEYPFQQLGDRAATRSHRALYETLQRRIGEAQFGTVGGVARALQSLYLQRDVVSAQIRSLVGSDVWPGIAGERGGGGGAGEDAAKRTIDGYLEIGMPGRYTRAVNRVLRNTGRNYVLHTGESVGDIVQCGFPRPYDCFVRLGDDYAPIAERDIDSASVDVASCLIGLHHAPPGALDAFVASVHRVLRPGGVFLVRDHNLANADVAGVDMAAFVTVVHSVFNAATGVSWADEAREVRNFLPLSYWDALMARNGFVRTRNTACIRVGDPTMNTLVCYVRTPSAAEAAAAESLVELTASQSSNGGGGGGDGDVGDGNAAATAVDEAGVGSAGRAPSGGQLQLQTFLTSVEWYTVDVSADYARFVTHTPFYAYPYFARVAEMWRLFGASLRECRRYHGAAAIVGSEHFRMVLFVACFTTAEFVLKGLIALPLNAAIGGANQVSGAIDMVLCVPTADWVGERGAAWTDGDGDGDGDGSDGGSGGERAGDAAELERRLRGYDARVRVLRVSERHPQYVSVRAPRYMPFTALVRALARDGVGFVSVAGNTRIQVKVLVTAPLDADEFVSALHGCRLVSSGAGAMGDGGGGGERSVAYVSVDTMHLGAMLRAVESAAGARVLYVHDF